MGFEAFRRELAGYAFWVRNIVVFSYDSPLPRFAPAEHVSDTELHLSASERAGLAQLLARKDELLALLD